jgi:hypothetical protein
MLEINDIESLVKEYPDTNLTITQEKEVTFEEIRPQIEMFFFVKQLFFLGILILIYFFKFV